MRTSTSLSLFLSRQQRAHVRNTKQRELKKNAAAAVIRLRREGGIAPEFISRDKSSEDNPNISRPRGIIFVCGGASFKMHARVHCAGVKTKSAARTHRENTHTQNKVAYAWTGLLINRT
jgi:hypothetical protein